MLNDPRSSLLYILMKRNNHEKSPEISTVHKNETLNLFRDIRDAFIDCGPD